MIIITVTTNGRQKEYEVDNDDVLITIERRKNDEFYDAKTVEVYQP